jgi:hypothetical protein
MSTLKDSAYNAPAALTITVASLATSTAGVGRQSTEIDNTTTRFQRVEFSASIKLGTSPVSNTAVYLYLIRSNNDGTPIRDDGAGASDAAWTQKAAPQIGVLPTGPSAATGDVLKANFIVTDVGAKWSLGLVNSSGAALDATGGNHVISYNGITTDIA